MKKALLILISVITLLPFGVNAEVISLDCSNSSSTRRCVLDAIDVRNKTNKDNSDYKHWIGLQIGIPVPNALCQKPEYLCYQGQLVGVKDAGGMLAAFFQFAIIMISITLSVVMVIGGVMYITSGGDAGRASKGKDFIRNASFSLVVLMFSVMILYQINPKLLSVNIAANVVSKVEAQISCNDSDSYNCGVEYVSPYTKGGVDAKCIGTKTPVNFYCGVCEETTTDPYCQSAAAKENPSKKVALPKKENNIACEANKECKSGLCMGSICRPIPQNIGSSCNTNIDCAGLVCATIGYNRCTLGRAGAPCYSGLVFSAPNECDDLHVCYDGPGELNFCIPKTGMLFQICSSDNQCGNGLVCSGVCTVKGSSSLCTSDADCEKLTFAKDSKPKCITSINTCSSKAVGSICMNDNDCNSNHCFQASVGQRGVCIAGEKGDYCTEGKDCQSNKCDTSKTGLRGICS